MAVTACLGQGDDKIVGQLPTKIPAHNILFVGLRDWEREQIRIRQKQLGIKHLTPADVANDS